MNKLSANDQIIILRSQIQELKREIKFLLAIKVATENALHRQSMGHSDGWAKVETALEKADDAGSEEWGQ